MSDFLGDLFREDNLQYFMDLFPLDASSHTLCSQRALAFFFHQEARRLDHHQGHQHNQHLHENQIYSMNPAQHQTIDQNDQIMHFHQNSHQIHQTSDQIHHDELFDGPIQKATQRAIADVYRFLAHTYEASPPTVPSKSSTLNIAGAADMPGSHQLPTVMGSLQTRRLLYKLLQDTLSEVVTTETQSRRSRSDVLADPLPGSRTAFLRKKWHKLRTNAQVALSAKPKKNPLGIPKPLLKRTHPK